MSKAEKTTGESESPFTLEQQKHIERIADEHFSGIDSMEGYVLKYIARFGVAPTVTHLCNNWQVHGGAREEITSMFPEHRERAIELLKSIGVEQQGTGELQTGFYPGQPTDTHIVPRFAAVREILDSFGPDKDPETRTDPSDES